MKLASEPSSYLVVFGDRLQHQCTLLDRAHAEGYAAQSHGLCLPQYLSEVDAAALQAKRGDLAPPAAPQP